MPPADSLPPGVTGAADDTGTVRIYPPEPRRGGVVFALAEGVATPTPRCTWKSAPVPCYRRNGGVLVAIPLSAEEDAGTFTLTVDRPNGRIVRQITVADRDYRATDSTRSIALSAQSRTRGTFAGDTSDAPLSGAPSWRHAGIDLSAKRGAAVAAPAAGIVADVGDYVLSGRTVLIDHGHGAVSAYFHLDTTVVAKGDMIRAGQRIGRVGATGLATGPHLHFGMYLHGKDVDPIAWRDMPAWLVSGTDPTQKP